MRAALGGQLSRSGAISEDTVNSTQIAKLRERLTAANEKLTYLQTRQERLDERAMNVTPGRLADGTYDSAVLSGTMRKPNPKESAARYRTYDLAASAQRELMDQERLVARLTKQLAHDVAEAERPRLTRADILGAVFVRTAYGWHKVVRVNATTVSVATGYSWVDRHPFDSIIDTRR